jgi:hypothetical protein
MRLKPIAGILEHGERLHLACKPLWFLTSSNEEEEKEEVNPLQQNVPEGQLTIARRLNAG